MNNPSQIGLMAALQEAAGREEYLKQRTLFLAQKIQDLTAALSAADARAAKAEDALKNPPQDGE